MSVPATPAPPTAPGGEASSRWFWPGLVVGWLLIGYAVWGIAANHDATNPAGLARWVLAGALAHDLVLAPAVLVVGAVLTRWLPTSARGPVRGALALTGVVVLFAYPLVRGFGRHPLNASALPLDYRRNVLVVVGAIWVVATLVLVSRRVRRVRRAGS